MSTALYRRYRPDTFANLIGQDHVTQPLIAGLEAGRISHAYLFSGPRGCGKTSSARIMARCLNCVEGPTPNPCGKCDSCVELATGGAGSLDVVEIDAASHNGVDDARELRERAAFAPVRDRFKVFILDEAHMVTPQGFNALLKLVEEPPPHIKFIFATTEPEKVIGTIRSRTHHYPFRLVAPEAMGEFITQICQREQITLGDGVLPLVVRAGGGSVRDTLSILDQLIGGATDATVTLERAGALLGYTDAALLDGVIKALIDHNGAALFTTVERVINAGQEPRRFVEDLLRRLRDMLILAISGQDAFAAVETTSHAEAEELLALGQRWGAPAISRAADAANEALLAMRGATSPRLLLELLCAQLLLSGQGAGARAGSDQEPTVGQQVPAGPAVGYAAYEEQPVPTDGPGSAAEIRALLARERQSREAPVTGAMPLAAQSAPPVQPEPEPTPKPAPAPVQPQPEPQPEVEPVASEAPDEARWQQILQLVAGMSKMAERLLVSSEAKIATRIGQHIIVSVARADHAIALNQANRYHPIEQAIKRAFGGDANLIICEREAVGRHAADLKAAPAPAPISEEPVPTPEPAPAPEPAEQPTEAPVAQPVEDEWSSGWGPVAQPGQKASSNVYPLRPEFAPTPAPQPQAQPEPEPEPEPELPTPEPTGEPAEPVEPAPAADPAPPSRDDEDVEVSNLVGEAVVENIFPGAKIVADRRADS